MPERLQCVGTLNFYYSLDVDLFIPDAPANRFCGNHFAARFVCTSNMPGITHLSLPSAAVGFLCQFSTHFLDFLVQEVAYDRADDNQAANQY